jgi:hypothetical protein
MYQVPDPRTGYLNYPFEQSHKRIGAFLLVVGHAFDRKVDWNLIAYARPSSFPSASSLFTLPVTTSTLKAPN